jgi:iron(III) transport system permease protein
MVGAGLVLPVTVMAGWVAKGIATHQQFADPLGPLVDTLVLALGGAILTLALAWLPAWASGRGRAWMEPLVLFTSALPGVLLALGLVLASLALSRALGGGEVYRFLLSSGVLLFLGYATRFVAEVFAPLRASVLALDNRQIESAQVLGASATTRLRRVIAPALAPGVAVAFLLGFVAILKELPVTLLLGGATGRKTLAFRTWDRYNEALWHDAGVAGLLLVACALLVAAGTLRWRHDV